MTSAAAHRPEFDQLFSTIASWREGRPTVLRTINKYNDWNGWEDAHPHLGRGAADRCDARRMERHAVHVCRAARVRLREHLSRVQRRGRVEVVPVTCLPTTTPTRPTRATPASQRCSSVRASIRSRQPVSEPRAHFTRISRGRRPAGRSTRTVRPEPAPRSTSRRGAASGRPTRRNPMLGRSALLDRGRVHADDASVAVLVLDHGERAPLPSPTTFPPAATAAATRCSSASGAT